MSEEQPTINEQLEEINTELVNPDLTPYQRRCLSEQATRLIAKGVVSKQEPYKPRMVKL